MRNAPVSEKAPVGVFVGLATLDVIHRIAKAPAVNQKITSIRSVRRCGRAGRECGRHLRRRWAATRSS